MIKKFNAKKLNTTKHKYLHTIYNIILLYTVPFHEAVR